MFGGASPGGFDFFTTGQTYTWTIASDGRLHVMTDRGVDRYPRTGSRIVVGDLSETFPELPEGTEGITWILDDPTLMVTTMPTRWQYLGLLWLQMVAFARLLTMARQRSVTNLLNSCGPKTLRGTCRESLQGRSMQVYLVLSTVGIKTLSTRVAIILRRAEGVAHD